MAEKFLKILCVADVSISPVIGGAERALFEYGTRLARRGHAVHILTRRLPGHTANRENINGVWEWRFEFDARNFLHLLYSTTVKSKQLFESLCKRFSFDIINAHQPFSALGVAYSPKAGGIKKVYTCHSLSFEEFKSRNRQPNGLLPGCLYMINWRLRRAIEHAIMKRSDTIVVLSEFTKKKLVHHYDISDDKIRIIPGGVDLVRFKDGVNQNALRKKLKIPSETIVLFTVRNLVARMGLENLLYAVSKIAGGLPELYLVIGGEGPLKEDMIALAQKLSIKDRIRFVGFIKEEDLPCYYQMADLFILPTKELEGFGLVTLEALASGLPVLGTPVGGTKEILERLNPELLFEDTSADAMATAILRMVVKLKVQTGLKESLSSQCRRFVETHYSWEDKIDSLERLFQE